MIARPPTARRTLTEWILKVLHALATPWFFVVYLGLGLLEFLLLVVVGGAPFDSAFVVTLALLTGGDPFGEPVRSLLTSLPASSWTSTTFGRLAIEQIQER